MALTGLSPNTSYTVSVRAVNARGNSSEASISFTTLPNLPGATTPTLASTSDTAASFTWPDAPGVVDNYEAIWSGQSSWANIGDINAYTLANLSASTAYTFRVRARNRAGAGAEGSVRFTTDAQPLQTPVPPTGVSVSNVTRNSFVVNYTLASSTTRPLSAAVISVGENVYVIPHTSGGTYSRLVSGLAESTTYNGNVLARNSAGDSSAVSFSARTLDPPPPPPPGRPFEPAEVTVTNITRNSATVNVTVVALPGRPITHVVIRLRGFSDRVIAHTGSGTVSHSFTGLTSDRNYGGVALTRNAVGDSAGVSVEFRTLGGTTPPPPGADLSVNVNASGLQASFSWSGAPAAVTIRLRTARVGDTPAGSYSTIHSGGTFPTGSYTRTQLEPTTIYDWELTSGTQTRTGGFLTGSAPPVVVRKAPNEASSIVLARSDVSTHEERAVKLSWVWALALGETVGEYPANTATFRIYEVASDGGRTLESTRGETLASAPGDANANYFFVRKYATRYQIGIVLSNPDASSAEAFSNIYTSPDDPDEGRQPPGAPTMTHVTTPYESRIRWVAADTRATSWRMKVGALAEFVVPGGAGVREYRLAPLRPQSNYSVRLRGFNSVTAGVASTLTFTTPALPRPRLPAAPLNLRIYPGPDSFVATWDAADDLAIGWRFRTGTGPVRLASGGASTRLVIVTKDFAANDGISTRTFPFELWGFNGGGDGGRANASVTLPPSIPGRIPSIARAPTVVGGNMEVDVQFAVTDEGGSPITLYERLRNTNGVEDAEGWVAFTPIPFGTSLLLHEDTGLVNGHSYSYQIRVTNSTGTSAPSPRSEEVTPADPDDVPDPPEQVLAYATGAPGEVMVVHPPSRSSAESPVTKYQHQTSTDGGVSTGAWTDEALPTDPRARSETAITGLADGVGVVVRERAVNRKGNSVPSRWTNFVTPGSVSADLTEIDRDLPAALDPFPVPPPDKPTGEVVTGGIRWVCHVSAPFTGVTLFAWQWATVDAAGVIGTPTTIPPSRAATSAAFDQTGLTANEVVRIVMRLTTDAGIGPWSEVSDPVSFSAAATVPSAPSKPRAFPISGGLSVHWEDNGDGNSPITKWQTSHRVVGTTRWGTWTDVDHSGADTRSAEILGLTDGTDYEVRVRAVNRVGNGTASLSSEA